MNYINIKKNKIRYVLLIGIFIFICSFLFTDFTFRNDEAFTLALIRHSYLNVIKFDSFDAHPPLYYILLKSFLIFTTFWTKSIFIKIFFARVFSLLTVFISFYFLTNLMKMLNIKNRAIYPLIFFLLFPSILFIATLIRMYALAGMFFVIEFYELNKFIIFHSNKFIVYTAIFAILTAYTHYYAAVAAGILLFITLVICFLHKDLSSSIKIFFVGISLSLSYIPWIMYSFHRLLGNNGTTLANNCTIRNFLKQIAKSLISITGITDSSMNSYLLIPKFLVIIILLFCLVYLVRWSFYNLSSFFNKQLIIILSTFAITLFISSVFYIIGFEYAARFLYPTFSVAIFFLVNIIICRFKRFNSYKKCNLGKIVLCLLIFILGLSSCSSLYFNFVNVKNSINVYKRLNNYKNNYIANKPRYSRFNKQSLVTHNNMFYFINSATYYYYDNKNIVTNSSKLPITNSTYLSHAVYPNLKIKKSR